MHIWAAERIRRIKEKNDSFDLQVYRKKHQSSEILCPTPLDLNVNYSDRFEYDPETFLEVYFGETGKADRVAQLSFQDL